MGLDWTEHAVNTISLSAVGLVSSAGDVDKVCIIPELLAPIQALDGCDEPGLLILSVVVLVLHREHRSGLAASGTHPPFHAYGFWPCSPPRSEAAAS